MVNLLALNIKDVKHLAKLLRTPVGEIERLCDQAHRLYTRREVKKKAGAVRVLHDPSPRLKRVQKRLNWLLQRVELPASMHGCRRGRSIIDNALPHAGKPMVLKMDVEDFFPRIRFQQVYRMFEAYGCSPDVAGVLTRLTTYNHQLPQGAPTSPSIANMVYAHTARRLQGLAEAHKADYSDYVDDNTFSGPRHLPRLVPLVSRILKQSGFKANPHKVQTLDCSREQIVTGVKVNDGIDAPPAYVLETERLIREYRSPGNENPAVTRAQIEGRINHIGRLNSREGSRLRAMLH
jgi:retron-type reverse transcriptase